MYAAFSITASVSASLSFNLSISFSACLRFLSAEECACVLLSHVLNLSIELFIDDVSGFPVESLFAAPITVDNPMSCIVNDVPAPTLVLFASSFAKERHSAPVSEILSETTKPHLPQNNSPVVSSVTIFLSPHEGHFGPETIVLFSISHNSVISLLFILPNFCRLIVCRLS